MTQVSQKYVWSKFAKGTGVEAERQRKHCSPWGGEWGQGTHSPGEH